MFDPQESPEEKKETAEEAELVSHNVESAVDNAVLQKCEEYKLGWQRALADYQNLQKETTTRRAEWAQMSKLQILEDFIPVYDNFKKAFASKKQDGWNKEQENWAMGIQFIMKQFGDVLKSHQIEEIKTVGEHFDPTRHEAVGEEAADDKKTGMIIREAEGGYLLGGKVVKVAKVIVAK